MSHDDKDSPLTTWLRRQGASALERDAADRIDQLERDLHKLEMEMPDYRECCALREKAERELAEVRADLKRERLGAFVDPQYSGHDVPTPAQRPSLGTPGGIPLDADFEHEAPDTPGTWQERCSVLYQVIGGMAAHFGIFETSDDVSAALDVAAGRGDVDKLLPWPKTALSHRATTDFDEWWAVWISSRQTPNKPSAKDAARAGWAARSARVPTLPPDDMTNDPRPLG